MFAQLGSLVFENLKGFVDYTQKGSAIYAEHTLLDGKPRLQRTGLALNEISLSVRLHASFCNPTDELKTLKGFRDAGEILPLLWGNGKVEGDFVITDIEEKIEHADPSGNVISYTADLTLKEYDTPDKLHNEQQANINKASGVGKKPIGKKKVNNLTCPQIIAKLVARIENHGAVVNKMYVERGGYTTANKPTIVSNAKAISDLATDIKNRTEDPKSCAYNDVQLRIWAQTVNSDASTIAFLNDPTADDNKQLQVDIPKLHTAARSYISKTITRKP